MVSLEARLTVMLATGAALAVTVPWTGGLPSVALTGRLAASVAVSLSATLIEAELLPKLVADAVTSTVCGPSRTASSMIVRSKLALVCPARMVTPTGTVTSFVLLEVSVTVKFVASVAGMRMVPAFASTPSPSVAFVVIVATSGLTHGP